MTLFSAARSGQIKAMQILIVNNAQIDATNEENWTPLFYAVSKKQYEAAELLLNNGADCTRVDILLYSCLHYAVKEDFCKIVYLLLQYGGDRLIYQRNSENRLALHEAILSGNEKVSLTFISDANSILHQLLEF